MPRMRRLRLHLLAVCELNRETWVHIRKEVDDDYEWLPHPRQTDRLGLPLSDEQIDAWLAMMGQWEGLLKGERLVPGWLLRWVDSRQDETRGLNVRKLLDDPPSDLLNEQRIRDSGIDSKYLEAQASKPELNVGALLAAAQLFNGPFGFAHAVRLN